MKRILLALLAFGGLGTGLHAQIPPQHLTIGLLNCRGWMQAFSYDMKLGFVIGYTTAIDVSKNREQQEAVGTNATYGEIARGVDALCAAPENGALTVPTLIIAFAAKTNGASEAQMKTMLEKLRRDIAEPERLK